MKIFRKKRKHPTVKESLREQIRIIEARIEESESAEEEYELYQQYYKLVDRYTEIEKIESNKWIDYGLKLFGILAPCILTIWGTKVTMRYEKEDVMTSTAGKQFFRKLF